jgi:hypothetical protein
VNEADDWLGYLAFLLAGAGRDLEGGAELEVSDPDGEVVFLAPLARHHRVEDGTVWVRPVVGGYRRGPAVPEYAFSLEAARPRALSPMSVRREGPELILELSSGQVARIRPADTETLPELQRWDTRSITTC